MGLFNQNKDKTKDNDEKLLRKEIMRSLKLSVTGRLTNKALDSLLEHFNNHHDKYNDWNKESRERALKLEKLRLFAK